MDTKAIAQRVMLRGKARRDPEWAWLMLRAELMTVIQDIAQRPDEYRQAIERYAPTMPPENAAAAREVFPGMLEWSKRGFGVNNELHRPLAQVHKVHRAFGEGNVLDPLFWCYYQHDADALADLRTLQEFATIWRRQQGFIK